MYSNPYSFEEEGEPHENVSSARTYNSSSNTSGSTTTSSPVHRYIIGPQDIRDAITHQHHVEECIEKRQSLEATCTHSCHRGLSDIQDIRQSMSFAESVLSSASATTTSTSTTSVSAKSTASSTCASVSSLDSALSSVFSALTVVTGNTNRYYGVPFGKLSGATKKHTTTRQTNPRFVSSSKQLDHLRFGFSKNKSDNDWDYNMDVVEEVGRKNVILKCETPELPPKTVNHHHVLHLKTRAYMSDFYADEFLMYFPQYPVPQELSANHRKDMGHDAMSLLHNPENASKSKASSWSRVSLDMISSGVVSPIMLAVDDSSFLDMAIYGSLGLGTARTEASQRLISKQKNSSIGMKDFLILGKSNGEQPLLVCSLKSRRGKPVVRIFSTKPRSMGQKSIICTDQLGLTQESQSHPLYTWAELRTEGEFPDANARYYLHTCTGRKNEFHKKPLLTAIHKCEGSTEIQIFGHREDREMSAIGEPFHCARVCVRTTSTSQRCPPEANFMISIVKGVEVANILAMVAVIDELIEFNMKKRCAILAWKFATNQGGEEGQALSEDNIQESGIP